MGACVADYIIPSDNWEQQLTLINEGEINIISYQAITGNNNIISVTKTQSQIISYQAITGNNNFVSFTFFPA